MALDTGNYISDFDNVNPTSSDLVSQGDDVLRFIKTCLQRTFPAGTAAYSGSSTTTGLGPDRVAQVLIAKSTAPTVDTSATGHAARAMGLTWLDTSANLVKMRNQANDAWITLPFDPEVNQKVIALAGTIDGTVIGGSTPAAITGTTLIGNTSLALATGATVTGIDNGALGSSATLLATQGAVKTYVDAQVTAQDLDLISDSGTIDIDLDSESLTVTGGEGIDTSATGTTLTIAGEDASTSNKGVASFNSANFAASSGDITIKDGGVANAELADMAANTVKVRDANSSGVPSDVALATTQILIGDGTGFTAAALSSDATMTNAGVVTVAKIQGQAVSATAATNDQYLKYSSASSEWQKVDVLAPDRLTTKGDLLVYNTVDSETRLPVGTNDYSLLADSSATNGVDWKQVPTAGIADDAVSAGKLADTAVSAGSYTLSSITVDAQGRLTSASSGTAGASAGFAVAMAIAL